MAYDPNFPFGYTPYNQRPQTSVYAFVNGIEGAKRYPLSPNQSMLLMDSEQSVCYLKQANALGQTTLKCFKLVEANESELQNTAPQPNSDYVTKADFAELLKRVEKLEPKGE